MFKMNGGGTFKLKQMDRIVFENKNNSIQISVNKMY